MTNIVGAFRSLETLVPPTRRMTDRLGGGV